MKKSILTKAIILVLFMIVITSGSYLGYAYFGNLSQSSNESINIGEWWNEGTAISTPQEFYDAVTNSNSTSDDVYYLTQDLDFEGFDWEFTSSLSNITFRGTLNGNNYSVNNLYIYVNSSSYSYYGLFAKMEGGTIKNISFDNYQLFQEYRVLNRSSMRTGLLVGRVVDGTNTFENITINDCLVIGSSTYGTGGLIGQVLGSNTVINISNISARNLDVYSKRYYTGGLIGYVYTSGATINIEDIDIQVSTFAEYYNGYSGGIIGRIRSGITVNINRVVVELNCLNDFYSEYGTLGEYTGRYIGGVIGYNQSNSVSISNTFVTGNMIPYNSHYYNYVGTLIARNKGSYSGENNYYSMIEFIDYSGNTSYTMSNPKGTMSTLVESNSMPSLTWWSNFSINFNIDNELWNQDESGRLYL